MVTEESILSWTGGLLSTEYFARGFYSKGTLNFDCINICIYAYIDTFITCRPYKASISVYQGKPN